MHITRILTCLMALSHLALAACANTADPTDPGDPLQPPPSLQDGTWALNAADGRPLPAVVAHRAVMGALEQTIIDSAHLMIRPDRTYEQRIWTRTLRDGAPSATHGVVDAGRWQAEADRYRFTSTIGARSLTVRNPNRVELRVTEPITTGPAEHALIVGSYAPYVRRVPVERPRVAGRWRARELAGASLPAAVGQYSNDALVPGVTEIRLDAAEVHLTDDGRYTSSIRYSEWNTLTPSEESSWRVRARFTFRDFGTYTDTPDGVRMTSAYYQNLVVPGSLVAGSGRLRLTQGLTPGESPLNIGYERVP